MIAPDKCLTICMTNQHCKGHAHAQIIADAAHCGGCRRFWAGGRLLGTYRRTTVLSPDKFECIGRRRSAWCTKAELSDQADSETPRRLPHADYVLHRAGCSQEDDQLLREGWQWHDSRRRFSSRHTL